MNKDGLSAGPGQIVGDYDSLADMYERNAEKTADPSQKASLLALARKFRDKAVAQRAQMEKEEKDSSSAN